jgi:hypothetical protein
MTTRQQVNETAANVAKLLNMMTRMPDEQVDYLFNAKEIDMMHAYSKSIIEKTEGMIVHVGDWYPACSEQVEGRLHRGDDET